MKKYYMPEIKITDFDRENIVTVSTAAIDSFKPEGAVSASISYGELGEKGTESNPLEFK